MNSVNNGSSFFFSATQPDFWLQQHYEMFWVFSELLNTALLITSKLIAINIFRTTNDHYIPLLPHAEGTKDLAEILSERESIAHTMQVFFTMLVHT